MDAHKSQIYAALMIPFRRVVVQLDTDTCFHRQIGAPRAKYGPACIAWQS